ncbi:hypothetical protein KI387_038937, partial [Taxus chinensis]
FWVRLEKALEGVNFVTPIQVAGDEDLMLEEARRVIIALSVRNTELMKFTSKMHGACANGFLVGYRLKNLDILGLTAPVLVDADMTDLFRRRVGFTYNYMLRRAREGVAVGGLRRLTCSSSQLRVSASGGAC